MEVVDDVKCERDAKKRLCGVNEICCILYPLFKEMLTEESEKQNQQSSGSGNGKPGNGVGSMTAEQLSEALKEAVKQIKQAAKNVGVNNLPDRHNNSITSQAAVINVQQ